MRRLSSQRAIDAWERGQTSDSQELPLALLSVALPDEDRERLARLSVGRRDALLMRLRERTFGRQVAGFAQCPQCGARLQFQLDLAAYDTAAALETEAGGGEVEAAGWRLAYRAPNSRDMARAARYPDEAGARRALLQACITAAWEEGREVPAQVAPDVVPEEVVVALGERLETADPLAHLPLAIDCAGCGHDWEVLFDVATLFWEEIASTAERLLHEVRALALTYGWSEGEILAMSEARRRFYLGAMESGGADGAAPGMAPAAPHR